MMPAEHSLEDLQEQLVGAEQVQNQWQKRLTWARIRLVCETTMLVIAIVGFIAIWFYFILGIILFVMIENAQGEAPGYFVAAIAWAVLWHLLDVSPKSLNRQRRKARDRLAGTKAFLETGRSVIQALHRKIEQRGAAGGE